MGISEMRLNRYGYLIREGFRSIFTHGFMSFASVTIIMACLIIMGSVSLLSLNIDSLIKDLEDQNEVVAFVDESITDEAAAKAIGPELRKIENALLVVFGFDLHAASDDLQKIDDDVAFENAVIICLQAVERFTAYGNDRLEFRIASELYGCHRGVALYDVKLTAFGILGAAGNEFFHAACDVCLRGKLLFDIETGAFRVFSAAFIDKDLSCDLFCVCRIFDEIVFDVPFQIIGKRGRDEFVIDRFFRLVFVGYLGGKAIDHQNKAVLYVLERDLAFIFIIFIVIFQIFIDSVHKSCLCCFFGGAAMLQKA